MSPHDISLPYGMKPREIAANLIANGYLPCPLQPRSKAITIPNWTNRIFEPEDFGSKSGVGIKTGNGLIAMDIDVYDEAISQNLADIAFEVFGTTAIREGEYPKKALLYRCSDCSMPNEIKIRQTEATSEGKLNKIELLQDNRQIVVAAIHPETKRPYKWYGEQPWQPVQGAAKLLPVITQSAFSEFMHAIADYRDAHQLLDLNRVTSTAHEDFSGNEGQPSLAEVEEVVSYINPSCDYETWLKITMGLKSLGDEFFDVWANWAAQGLNHNPKHDLQKWKQVKPSGGVTYASVCYLAQQNGADLRAIRRRHNGHSASQIRTKTIEKISFETALSEAGKLQSGDVESAIELVKKTAHFGSLHRDAVDRAIKSETSIGLTVLRSQRAEILNEGNVPDDLDHAKSIIQMLGSDNILHANDKTYTWRAEGVWRSFPDRNLKQLVQKVLKQKGVEVRAPLVNSVADVLKSEINKPDHQFNGGPLESINCLNGHVEHSHGKWQLLPHVKTEYRTTQIPVCFDTHAQAPNFIKFLEQIFEFDEDRERKTECLLQMMGYSLMNHARHEKFAILIGSGANGKSVLLNVLTSLCGMTNVSGVQPSKFDSSFQRAELEHKLVNIITELSEGEKLKDAELKSIVSGEPTTVEHKYAHPFVMQPYSTCWFGTNHMPQTTDSSNALFRRSIIFTFNRTFAPEEQDKNLKDKLVNELSGILNLVLRAYSTVLQSGFSIPISSIECVQKWRKEIDQVATFIEARCMKKPEERVQTAGLYAAYTEWVKFNLDTVPLHINQFSQQLKKLGFELGKSGSQRHVKGLCIK